MTMTDTGTDAGTDPRADAASPDLREQILADPGLILDDTELMRALLHADRSAQGRNVVDLRGVLVRRACGDELRACRVGERREDRRRVGAGVERDERARDERAAVPREHVGDLADESAVERDVRAGRVVEEDIGHALDHRQRRAQFMAGVGEEGLLAQLASSCS